MHVSFFDIAKTDHWPCLVRETTKKLAFTHIHHIQALLSLYLQHSYCMNFDMVFVEIRWLVPLSSINARANTSTRTRTQTPTPISPSIRVSVNFTYDSYFYPIRTILTWFDSCDIDGRYFSIVLHLTPMVIGVQKCLQSASNASITSHPTPNTLCHSDTLRANHIFIALNAMRMGLAERHIVIALRWWRIVCDHQWQPYVHSHIVIIIIIAIVVKRSELLQPSIRQSMVDGRYTFVSISAPQRTFAKYFGFLAWARVEVDFQRSAWHKMPSSFECVAILVRLQGKTEQIIFVLWFWNILKKKQMQTMWSWWWIMSAKAGSSSASDLSS